MNTKETLLLVGVLGLGFLAWKHFDNKKKEAIKLADCQAQLLEKTKVMRGSAESLEKFKSEFMAECLAS